MSSPVSSRRLANLVKESLQGSVLGGVVSDAVLPAVSDDVKQARARMRTACRWSWPRARVRLCRSAA